MRLAAGSGISLSLTQAGITVQGKGDMALEAENIIIVGKHHRMNAKSYIYFKCQGAGIAILPSAIHILGYRVYLQDNPEKRFEMNNKRESASVVEQIMQGHEERLRGPVPLFAADGSAVRREGFDEFVHTEAQFEY